MDEIEKLVERLLDDYARPHELAADARLAASTLTTQAAELACKDARIKELEAGLAKLVQQVDLHTCIRLNAPKGADEEWAAILDHARSLVLDGEATPGDLK